MTGAAGLMPTWYEMVLPARNPSPALDGPVTADACVVGAGFAGTGAALTLARAGLKTILLEAASAGAGASGRNGGQIHTGQRVGQATLEARLGEGHARDLWRLGEEAKTLVHGLAARDPAGVQLRHGLIHAAWKRRHWPDMEAEASHMREAYAAPLEAIAPERMRGWIASEAYHGGVYDPGGGHLNPLALVRATLDDGLAAGVTLHERTPVLSVESGGGGHVFRTPKGEVRARLGVLACDSWLGALAPQAGAHAIAINSFVGVTEQLDEKRARALIPSGAAVSDTKFVVDYYRVTPDRRLLFGGGETYTPRYPRDLTSFVRARILKVFPQLADVQVEHAWGGPVGITLNRLPHLGFVRDGLAFAHGFSGQGVIMAPMAGVLMAEALMGRRERFDILARIPHRAIPGGRLLRTPLNAAAMAWYALRDRV
jgi:gamma-glutamylputrescine oxidase